jgi:cysteine desulfuration protein SufE
MSSPLPSDLERLVQRLQRATDPKRKYELLLMLAQRLKPFLDAERVAENKVPGCTSQVYITVTLDQDSLWWSGDSDSQLVKGLVALLIEGLNGLTPEAILRLTPDFIHATGLDVSLTPSRANGFYNIFKFIQYKASIYAESNPSTCP